MMTPINAFNDPDIGPILLMHRDLVRGDLLVTVYVMHELRKKETSFYFPYLDILPEINNLSEWTDEELKLLQDERLVAKVESIKRLLRIQYAKSIVKLSDMFPESFPPADFTFEIFVFAWYTIQARAFGRRLPWTALVPFADCLNHKNVQTKYDFKPKGDPDMKQFRLLLSGNNRYPKGTEAFNSYGRRPNDNLLLEYGFAMLDNEWDEILVPISFDSKFGLFDDKVVLACASKRMTSKSFYIQTKEFNNDMLQFLRVCVVDTVAELDFVRVRGWEHGISYEPISLENEVKALIYFAECMDEFLAVNLCSETDIDSDLNILGSLRNTQTEVDTKRSLIYQENRLKPALYYRLTRKNIAAEIAKKTRILVRVLSAISRQVPREDSIGVKKVPAFNLKDLLDKELLLHIRSDKHGTGIGEGALFSFLPDSEETTGSDYIDPFYRSVLSGFIYFGDEEVFT